MSEPEHPSALALDSLAAGDPVPEAKAHVETCARCTEYVETVRAEAAAFANAAPPAFLANLEAVATSEESRREETGGARAEETPANAGAEDARVTRLADARAKRERVLSFAYAALPLALVAAALFVLRPTSTPSPDGFPTTPTESTMRLKGPPVLAVVRDRHGAQERFTSTIAVAPDDRLRLELTVDREGMYEAGLLGEDGSWLMLLLSLIHI